MPLLRPTLFGSLLLVRWSGRHLNLALVLLCTVVATLPHHMNLPPPCGLYMITEDIPEGIRNSVLGKNLVPSRGIWNQVQPLRRVRNI